MNTQRLAQLNQDQWRWHYTRSKTQLSIAREARDWQVLPDDTWLQQTKPNHQRPLPPPKAWLTQIRLWRKHLAKLAVTDFQMTCQRRMVFLHSPRPKWLLPIIEWGISWTIPSRGLGTLVGSLNFRQNQPPTQFLLTFFNQLNKTPRLNAQPLPHSPITIDGRRLIHFLGPAMNYLQKNHGDQGTWHQLPKNFANETQPHQSIGTPLDDPPQVLPIPLLPKQLHYIPKNTIRLPNSSWHAIHYESDQNTLTCQKFSDGTWLFAKFSLEQPLYQRFNKLAFTKESRHLVIRNRQIFLPDGVLMPNTPS